ncbi:hypothetical protein N182_11485 [Sinorhizobium sp. GL2]|nr:hypothetical protein N182_11485 [Sinorhizobium sp. GL2]
MNDWRNSRCANQFSAFPDRNIGGFAALAPA